MGRRRSKVLGEFLRTRHIYEMRRRRGLNPPYSCAWCEKENSLNVGIQQRGEVTIVVASCANCNLVEIMPYLPVFDPCDYYGMICDNVQSKKVPVFRLTDSTPEQKAILEGLVTLGKVEIRSGSNG